MSKLSIDDRLRQITPKTGWARKRIEEFERLRDAFNASNPYGIATKRNPDTRRLIYYVTKVEPVPAEAALIAADVIQNLMSALDHLAYQLICAATYDRPPNPFGIYFPIADSATKYKAKKRDKMVGARPATITAIDGLKPYKGGNDLLWALSRLNNIDKHRLLIIVGARWEGFDAGAMGAQLMQKHFADKFPAGAKFPEFYIRPADDFLPLKVGDELLIDAIDAEVNEKMQFRFDIAFREPDVPQEEPLLIVLLKLAAEVDRVIAVLTPELA